MPNKLAHFAIEADDVDRARAFYEQVFGWTFQPWGPPGFYLIRGAGVHAALQKRMAPAPTGWKGFECSFAVHDLDAATKSIGAAGGRILGSSHAIPTVGRLVQFEDTESNQAIIIQYETERLKEMGLG
ncbi:VOC family protein [bacterium]|nr:VOC family protein [bacterium]